VKELPNETQPLVQVGGDGLLAVACQDPRPLTSPPSFLIQDAAHSGGNPHVYWLPPMEAQPKFTGTFNGTLSPVIEISELPNAATPTCGRSGHHRHVHDLTGPGGEKVGVDIAARSTRELAHEGLPAQRRLQLSDQGVDLRPVAAVSDRDVDVVSSGAALKRVDTDEFVRCGRPYAPDQATD